MKTCCHTVVTCLIVTQWHTMASGRTWLDERATRMASAWTGTGFLAWQDPHYYRPLCRLKLLGLLPFLVLSLGLSLFLYFPFNFHWHVDKRVLTQYDWAVKWNPVDSNLFYVDTEVLPHSTSFLCLPHLHLFFFSLALYTFLSLSPSARPLSCSFNCQGQCIRNRFRRRRESWKPDSYSNIAARFLGAL